MSEETPPLPPPSEGAEKPRRKSARDPNISPKTGRPKDMRYSRASTMHFPSRRTPEVIAKVKEGARKGGLKGRRTGIPDGFGYHKREELAQLRAEGREEARRIIAAMVDQGLISTEEGLANEALEFAISVVRANVDSTKDRLAASKLVLEYTKAKPAQTVKATLEKAEDFLAALAADLPR